MAHGGSRGEATVVNTSARVSGRQSRLQWSIISAAPAGARFLFCFFFPWLAPWATFYRRYAACIRSLATPGASVSLECALGYSGTCPSNLFCKDFKASYTLIFSFLVILLR